RTQRLHDLMAEPNPPTAIFCWRDWLAYAALECCETLAIQVPHRLTIVGYDGLQWPASTRHTAASVCVDLDALADTAISLLLGYISGMEEEVVERIVPVFFMSGTTFGAAPNTDIP
ncbi:MAG TPA: substrate-binding domain-containing protein, partial [Chthonomonadales bacterium]|nr:substrate-binding domain-containing protein [Chthonomonadales bacterium]